MLKKKKWHKWTMACWHQAYQRPSCPSTISFWHHLQSNSSVSLQADSPRGKKRKKKTHNMLGIREKLVWWDKAYQIIPPLSIVEAPPPPRALPWDQMRASVSPSLQFTLATNGRCLVLLLLHMCVSCSPGSRKYRHAPNPASTKTETSR